MSDTDLKPTTIVIFGITGDLAQRKLLPALYHLVKDNLLHPKTRIVGVTRRDISAEQLLNQTELCVLEEDSVCDPQALKRFRERVSLYKMDLTDDKDYQKLREYINKLEDRLGVCMNRLYYLSIPPQVFGPIIERLGSSGLKDNCQHGSGTSHLLIEKPFGYDLASAKELITETNKQFSEKQVFRIDHYLAKETAQNILTFRFHNPIFEPLWNKQFVKEIVITAIEKIGIEGRSIFYEQTGALRDIIQSHLLQLLAITTMEKPKVMTAAGIHDAKLKLLQEVEPVPEDKLDHRAIRGQYRGYRQEVANPDSIVETFAALELYIDNPRWQGVPIYLRTGKAVDDKSTTISLTFAETGKDKHTNTLTFYIQPNEAIGIDLCVKRPGFDDAIETANMDFVYHRTFYDHGHPDAYERVLVDAIRGDHTLFATKDEVLASWQIIQPLIDRWSRDAKGLHVYEKGSAGPKA